MDLTSLREAAANLTLYDIKAGVRKVQNGNAFSPSQFHMLTVSSGNELHGDGSKGQRSNEQ